MSRKQNILTTVLIVIAFSKAFCQNSLIRGSIVDSINKLPLEYCSISLLNSSGNDLISGTISDKKGRFKFTNIPAGSYAVKIYFLGYETKTIAGLKIVNEPEIVIETVSLNLSNQMLAEVTVSGKKSNFSNKIDKQEYKTSQFEAARGGTASDIVKNLPSVTVSADGQISMRGSNGFLIMINGKPIIADASTILSQIPANTVQSVELVTAPSAKYDPDGRGGIINIVTAKNTLDGLAILANAMGGLPSTNDYDNLELPIRFGGDMTLNYKKNKVDFSLTANYLRNDNNGYRAGEVFSKDFEKNTITRYPSNGERSFDKYNYGIKTAFTYTFDQNNALSFGYNFGQKYQARRADILYNNSTADLLTNNIVQTNSYFNSNVQTKEGQFTIASIDYAHSFDKKSTVTSSVLFERANLYGNTVNLNLDDINKSRVYQKVTNPYTNPLSGIRFKIDYVLPIATGKLETGYQYRQDWQKGSFGFTISPELSLPADYTKFTGTAKTKNLINALYTQFSDKINKLNYILGLRYEYAKREVILSNDPNPHLFNFSNLFPSANLNYSFNNSWSIKANYSKRIQRNNNSELNPIPEREHSETLEQGDPDLLPQFIDLAEIGINNSFKKGNWFANLYFQNIKNPVQRVNSVYNDTILNRVYTNAARARLLGLEFGANYKPTKWVNLYFGANVYNYKISGELQVLGERSFVSNADLVYSLNGNTTFYLGKTWSIVPAVNYISKRPTAQGQDSSFLSPNLSIKKMIFDGRASFALQWQHIDLGKMRTNEQRITTSGTDFYTTTNYIYETNVFLVNFSYNFNKLSSKNKLPNSEFGEKEY